jgi:N-acetylneuraminic acid mutarotase
MTTLRQVVRIASLLLIPVLLLAACAGGDSPAATPAPIADILRWEQVRFDGGPGARRDATLVHDSAAKRLILFGGRANGQGVNDTWSFDIASGRWTKVSDGANGPSARWGHVAVYDAKRSQMIVFSGQSSTGFFNDVWIFNPSTNQWREVSVSGGKPPTRYGSCAAYDGAADVIYISHGFTSSGRFDDTWAFDLATSQWRDISAAGAKPIKRCLHRCAFDLESKTVVLFGGQSNETPILGDLWRFNPATHTWTELPAGAAKPSPRFFSEFQADPAASRFIVFGGFAQSGNVNDVWTFGASSGWSSASIAEPLPAARQSHAGAADLLGRSLYVYGGAGGSGELSDLWRLRLK